MAVRFKEDERIGMRWRTTIMRVGLQTKKREEKIKEDDIFWWSLRRIEISLIRIS